jgi:hypothetical protein
MSMFVSRSRRFGLGSLIAVVVALVTQIGSASAAAVHCGDVIRRSVTLTTDVGPCSGNGVIVGADNVKVDLGGHRVLGSATTASESSFPGDTA